MKKKKLGIARETRLDTVDEAKPGIDLKALIHEHSLFFDKLIDLIPAKFYLSTDDTERKWFPGLSKEEKALAKEETRENIKKARRDRLDPEKSSLSTIDLVMQNLQKEKLKEESDGGEVEINPSFSVDDGDERKVTYEELQQRLNRKLKEFRAGRGDGKDQKKKAELRENKRKMQKLNKNKKKRKREGEEKKELENAEGNKRGKRKRETEENKASTSTSVENVEKDISEAAMELKFSQVKIGNEDNGNKKKRKLSKLQELKKAKELAEAKMDTEKGGSISWKAATSRAAGIKVHDDPKLLNKSIKKEKKRHQKNVEKWKERVENQQKVKEGKQQKRSQNIADRTHQKKMRKIAKREKKLLDKPRPGFEGRVEGYINENTT